MQNQKIEDPPKWALRFLRWFCHPDMVEDIEGDLFEQFQIKASENGVAKANKYFIRQVLLLFRPGIINYQKPRFLKNHNGILKKYLQFTGRQLLHAKNYAFILNEAAAKKFNIKTLDRLRIQMKNVAAGEPKTGEVTGIVKDFHLKSLHHEMEPVVLTVSPVYYFLDNFVIRLQTDNLEQY